MEAVKDRFLTIVVTAVITSLLSVGTSAIYFYFNTNYAVKELYEARAEDKEMIEQLKLNDKRQDEVLVRYIENQLYIKEKIDKLDGKFDKFVEGYYNRYPRQ